MKPVNWKSVVELAGIAGILLGLYFVYAELQQSGMIARAELNTYLIPQYLDIQEHFSDPEFSELYLKASESADVLTIAERRQLYVFYEGIGDVFMYENWNYQLGIFADQEGLPRKLVRRYLTGQFGRAWWAVTRNSIPEGVKLVVDDEMSKIASANLDFEIDLKLLEEIEKN
jgi:hypothetical protein